jgi:hypothetical protein
MNANPIPTGNRTLKVELATLTFNRLLQAEKTVEDLNEKIKFFIETMTPQEVDEYVRLTAEIKENNHDQ